MRNIKFKPTAFSDYSEWAKKNSKIFLKLTKLITEISKNPFEGSGKPEALKHRLSGLWSRRLTKEHRIVYEVNDEEIIIISCMHHY